MELWNATPLGTRARQSGVSSVWFAGPTYFSKAAGRCGGQEMPLAWFRKAAGKGLDSVLIGFCIAATECPVFSCVLPFGCDLENATLPPVASPSQGAGERHSHSCSQSLAREWGNIVTVHTHLPQPWSKGALKLPPLSGHRKYRDHSSWPSQQVVWVPHLCSPACASSICGEWSNGVNQHLCPWNISAVLCPYWQCPQISRWISLTDSLISFKTAVSLLHHGG